MNISGYIAALTKTQGWTGDKLQEFYKEYLKNHSNPKCRLLHFIGQLATLFTIFLAFYTKSWILFVAIPFVVYPFAISGHILFGEKGDKPSFKKMGFLKAKAADALMFIDIIRGRLSIW